MRGRAGSVAEISVSPAGILASGLEMRPFQQFSPVTGMSSSNEFCIVLLCRCIFFIISILFDNSDTAFRVSKAITGAKVITLCLIMFVLFPEFRATTRLRPSHLGNRAEISHMNPR